MYLTETDRINAKITVDAAINNSNIILGLIKADLSSRDKKLMQEGERYYSYEHDIYNKDFTKTTIFTTQKVDGTTGEFLQEFVNPNRSNHHSPNPFHRILVDQKAAYIASKEPTITVSGASDGNKDLQKFEEVLAGMANEDFNEMLTDLVVGASNKGYEAIHFFYDEKGELQHCIVPANELIPIYDTKYQTKLLEVVRYYTIQVIKDGEKVTRKKVEWWTDKEVTYFVEDEENQFIKDPAITHNPMPHWWGTGMTNGQITSVEGQSWGRVPFILLKNNSRYNTDLESIKPLIDAYDLISSDGTNNALDHVALYWAMEGYGGEIAGEFAKKLQVNRAVSIEGGNGGNISAKQVDLPISGIKEWLDMLRRDIYHFGQGVDTDTSRFGTAPSGVSLKFQYSLLDLKANNMIPKLKKAIKEFFWFLVEDYNRRNGTSYDCKLINVSINKATIANDYENVKMLKEVYGIISDKTLIGTLPMVDDVNDELAQIKEQRENERKQHE